MRSVFVLLSCAWLATGCGRAPAARPAGAGPVAGSAEAAPAALPVPAAMAAAAEAAAETPAPAVAAAEPAASDEALPAAVRPFPPGLQGELVFQSDRDGQTRVYALDLASGVVRRVGPTGDWFDEEPQWSPDGRRIAFASTRGQADNRNIDIFVMDADGGNLVRMTDHPAKDQGPTWAADGQSIFFTSERDGRGEIYRVWLGDKRVDRVTNGINRAIMPAVSPDGKYLAYAAQTIMAFQIHLIDLQTGAQSQITGGAGACNPTFSPDSQEVAFVRLEGEPSRLEAVRTSGLRTTLADKRLWSYYPEYSPDGRYLAFSVSPEHHRGEDWDLALMDNTKPGSFVRLTSGPGNDRSPDWRPPVR